MSRAFLLASLLLVSAFLFGSISSVSATPSVGTLTSPNSQTYGYFGFSVAASGNIVVVGADSETADGYSVAGHAYTFNAATGALVSTLTSPNAQAPGNFGYSVAASGNIVVVGAPDENNLDGNAYIFSAATGTLVSTLANPNPQANAKLGQAGGGFGTSVAASGNIVVVGAPDENAGGHFGSGSAYIFNAATGTLVSTLTSPNEIGGEFGYSVAASGNIVVVGSLSNGAYIFNATTDALVSTLTSPNPQDGGGFGSSVAASGNVVVVGAGSETADGYSVAGHAYIFNAATDALVSTLTSPNPQTSGGFGTSVAASGNTLVASDDVEGAGSAYIFNAATGTLVSSLTDPNSQAGGYFGSSVAASGNIVVVGADSETSHGYFLAGNAYTFTVTAPTTTVPEFPVQELALVGLVAIAAVSAVTRRSSS